MHTESLANLVLVRSDKLQPLLYRKPEQNVTDKQTD